MAIKARFEHNGVKIELHDDGRFMATVGDVDLAQPTLTGLQEKIDRELAADKRVKTIKVSLDVIGIIGANAKTKEKLYVGNVTGVNRTTRELKLDPSDSRVSTILPDTEKNRRLVQSMIDAKAAFDAIEKQVRELQMTNTSSMRSLQIGGSGWGRIDGDEYPKVIESLVKMHEKASR